MKKRESAVLTREDGVWQGFKFTKGCESNWDSACDMIKFKDGIFSMQVIDDRLFVFCPDKTYEMVEKKKGGFKKVLCKT